MRTYVQYGCGLSAPAEWINFDISPTLRIQKTPIIGTLLKNQLNTRFPDNVRYGDIVRGLPVDASSCDGLYCSHVLEHLSLQDFRKALRNSYKILKAGGIFRCVIPDLEFAARNYLRRLDNTENDASIQFMAGTQLGVEKRPRGLKEQMGAIFGNSHHLWMWDRKSLGEELKAAGFQTIRPCNFNDSGDEMFKLVEDEGRFAHAAAIESIK